MKGDDVCVSEGQGLHAVLTMLSPMTATYKSIYTDLTYYKCYLIGQQISVNSPSTARV